LYQEEREKQEQEKQDCLATLLTATPSLRAKFFANPTKQVGEHLPPNKSWTYAADEEERYREKQRLAEGVLRKIAQRVKDGDLSSTVNTDSVFEDYFRPIVRASERSFTTMFVLSIGAFLVGVGLIVAGIYIAVKPRAGTNSTVVASIFGGAGAISALGSVFAMAQSGIRTATSDHAKLRVVLTGFATELGQLRRLAEGAAEGGAEAVSSTDLKLVNPINEEIRVSMKDALGTLVVPTGKDGRQASD
jgi:hypothetical protein